MARRDAASSTPTAIVFGVGPANGLGAALARRFAAEGLRVVIVARNATRLEGVAAAIRASGGVVEAIVADVTRADDVAAVFAAAQAAGAVELVVYNVGANRAAPLREVTPDAFEELWRQNAYGGFLVGQETVRHLVPQGRGTLLFTGATASLRARPPFAAFASAKAALRAVAQGLAREFGPAGIHVAHVVIDAVIDGEHAAGKFPQLVAAKGADGLAAPDALAETYWQLHRQPRSAWTHELDLRPFKEPF